MKNQRNCKPENKQQKARAFLRANGCEPLPSNWFLRLVHPRGMEAVPPDELRNRLGNLNLSGDVLKERESPPVGSIVVRLAVINGSPADEFWQAYQEWKTALAAQADPLLSTHPAFYSTLPAYRRIVDLGPGVLPFLMECLKQGEFLLNLAVEQILKQSPPGEIRSMEGEQAVSRWWLDRWNQNSKTILGQ